MLDVDLGTYPYVTSSNTTAGYAATGTGIGPRVFDDVLGIVKAYTTRVGAGPFPDRAVRRVRRAPRARRPRVRLGHRAARAAAAGSMRWRCGAAIVHSSVSGLCITKLDVLDGLETIRICVGYRIGGKVSPEPPLMRRGLCGRRAGVRGDARLAASRRWASRASRRCRPTRGVTSSASQALAGVPIDMISTGPDRDQTIVLRHPFGA